MVMNTFNIKFSILSYLACWHLFYSPPLVISLKREERQSFLSSLRAALAEQDSHDGIRVHRRAAPSTQVLLLFAWGAGILSHCSDKYPPLGFHVMLLQKLSDPSLSVALLFTSQQQYICLAQASGFVKPPKWPTQRHHQGKRTHTWMQPALKLQPSHPGAGKGLRPPPHHCSWTFSPLLGLHLTENQNHWLYLNSISPSSKLSKTSSTKLLLSSKIYWCNKFLGPSLSSPITTYLHQGPESF